MSQDARPNFLDAFVSREHRFSLGLETWSGRLFLSTPVSGRMLAAEYEAYFEIDRETYERFCGDPAQAEAFVERCRMGEEAARRRWG